MDTNWAVLCIGGASCTGKSFLARQFACYHNIPFIEVDDIRIALRTVITREDYPDLFTFVDNPNFLEEFSEERFVTGLVNVGRALWPALNVLIDKHVQCGEQIILEGDGIIPELLASSDPNKVKTIFLYDTLESIQERIENRNRHGKERESAARRAALSFAYSETIRKQAEQYGLPTLLATPNETLFERVLTLL